MPAPPSNLWLAVPAPSRAVALGWLAWVLGASGAAALLAGALGPAGVATVLAVGGAWLARRFPGPHECGHRHHLDDLEVIRLGPGRMVRRLEWSEVVRCAQTRHALVLSGGGRRFVLPLGPLVDAAAWGPVLARIVPARAEALWQALDGGAVVLQPPVDPPLPRAVAWTWTPIACAALATGSPALAAMGAGLAGVERLVVHVRRRLRSVVLQPGGLVVPGTQGRFFAPWDGVAVEPIGAGLRVRSGTATGLVPADVADFWAAAAVIELHAQLGFSQADLVRFRVRVEGAEIAVVGEVDAS